MFHIHVGQVKYLFYIFQFSNSVLRVINTDCIDQTQMYYPNSKVYEITNFHKGYPMSYMLIESYSIRCIICSDITILIIYEKKNDYMCNELDRVHSICRTLGNPCESL